MVWTEDMWILVLQLLQRKPVGVKQMYAPATVDLALELHIPPEEIYRRMFMLRKPESRSLRHLVETVGSSVVRLNRTAAKIRQLRGCGNEKVFFEGVEVIETFEKNFRPVSPDNPLTPAMLVMILDLYFRLVPSTMVRETPDVKDLAELMHITADDVVYALEIFQYCDPYIRHTDSLMDPLLPECFRIWRRFDTDSNPSALSNLAQQLSFYWK